MVQSDPQKLKAFELPRAFQLIMAVVKGKLIDSQTRCVHYHSPLDIIAIKFKCCNDYYPCYYCHQENTDHTPVKWRQGELDTKAILCGVCKHEITIRQYLGSNNQCPFCAGKFNPKCSIHYPFYFEL